MKLKEMTTRQRLKFSRRRLKKRQNSLLKRREYKKALVLRIKEANARIARIKSELTLVSDDGVQFVAHFEGFPNNGKPYNDPVGHCTVGYGHLLHRGNCVSADMDDIWLKGQKKPGILTKEEGIRLLRQDLNKFARGVQERTKLWNSLRTHEKDALVSFAFNVGLGAYGSSTLLKKLNQGDKPGAAKEFARWVYADGIKLPGLERRREAERKMFLGI